MRRHPSRFFLAAALAAALSPRPLWACAACFGQSDSGMAQGMNFGILSLLVVVVFTLAAVASFFIYLARRAASLSRMEPPRLDPTTDRA